MKKTDSVFGFARAPSPPYCAVIFSAVRAEDEGGAEYEKTSARMRELAGRQEGFLGMESAGGLDGLEITVSYWRDSECARRWKENAEHLRAQRRGREKFYRAYRVRVCRVEREYGRG